MANLVLFASADPASQRNYAHSMTSGVPLSLLAAHLGSRDMDLLRLHFEGRNVPIWGVWPGSDGQQVKKWDRVQDGDLAAFSRRNGISAHARVVHTFRSASLASAIWADKQTDNGPAPYELLFALDEITQTSVDYSALNPTLPGYSANATIRQLIVSDSAQSAAAQGLITGSTPSQALRPAPLRVATERSNVGAYITRRSSEPTPATRVEAELVGRYIGWVEAAGGTTCRHRIPLPEGGSLFTDVYDIDRREVVEAKSDSTRNSIRMALGQVLDYSRLIPESNRRAVLLPQRPREDLVDLLLEYQVTVIWESGRTFARTEPANSNGVRRP